MLFNENKNLTWDLCLISTIKIKRYPGTNMRIPGQRITMKASDLSVLGVCSPIIKKSFFIDVSDGRTKH